MAKYWLVILLSLLVLPMASALANTQRQNSDVNITHSVRLDGYVSDTINCNITVFNPNWVTLVGFSPMVYNATSKTVSYVLRSGNTSELGLYPYDVTCVGSGLNRTDSFNFEITPNGKENTISQSILYVLMLVVVVGLFGLTFYGSYKIPWKNEVKQNEYGEKMLKINYKKYLKLCCIACTYFSFVWILFLSANISYGFLGLATFANIFLLLFNFFVRISILVGPALVIYGAFKFNHDRKIQERIQRGFSLDDEEAYYH